MIFSVEVMVVIGLMLIAGLQFGWLWALVQLLCFICLAMSILSEMLTFGHARKDGADIKKAKWVAGIALSAALLLIIWQVLL